MSSIPKYNFANVPTMWEPKSGESTETEKFGKGIAAKYNVKIESYWDLHRWSVENITDFWAEMWNYGELIHSKSYDKVIDETLSMQDIPKWFEGSRLNFAENVLRYRDEKTALIVTGEDQSTKYVYYSEVYVEVCKYGATLKQLGLEKGDRVAGYMSNREEAIYAMLATVAAGAIWMGVLPLFGAKAVIRRFQQASPKFLFTIDKFVYLGEEKEMLSKIAEISNAGVTLSHQTGKGRSDESSYSFRRNILVKLDYGLPSLKRIVIIPSKPESLNKDISGIKNSCFLHEFFSYALQPDSSIPELTFQQVPFSHPIFISFTSGTTGPPKAMMHGCGVLLNVIRDNRLHTNNTRADVHLSTSPTGWASWNMCVSSLCLGHCLVLYDGMPFLLSPNYLWNLVDELKITRILVTQVILSEMEKRGYLPGEENTLSSLKYMIGASSVIKPQAYDFVYNKIKRDIVFSSFYASTECIGFSAVADYSLQIYRGEISAPALGVSICCFDEEGMAVEGEVGELVFTKPSPYLPIGMWGDVDGTIFRDTYFSIFSGVFRMGDMCLINPITKGIIIYGRSDTTLKPGGTRFGSSEIYQIVEMFQQIHDSICVSQYNKERDERAVLFLQLSKGEKLTNKLLSEIRNAIEKELSRNYVPEIILETKQIPYNMNGKKMENTIKKIINGLPYNDETIINPECLLEYQNLPQLKYF